MVSDRGRKDSQRRQNIAENSGEKMANADDEAINRKEVGGKGNPQPAATNDDQEEKDRLDAALALASIFTASKGKQTNVNNHDDKQDENHDDKRRRVAETSLEQVEASRKNSLASSPGSRPSVNNSSDMLIPTPVFALVSSHSLPTTPTFSHQDSIDSLPQPSSKVKKPKEKTVRGKKKGRYGLPETITVPKGVLPSQVLGTLSVSVASTEEYVIAHPRHDNRENDAGSVFLCSCQEHLWNITGSSY